MPIFQVLALHKCLTTLRCLIFGSELPVDVNQANPGSSSSAAHAAGSTLQGSRTRPKPSPRVDDFKPLSQVFSFVIITQLMIS